MSNRVKPKQPPTWGRPGHLSRKPGSSLPAETCPTIYLSSCLGSHRAACSVCISSSVHMQFLPSVSPSQSSKVRSYCPAVPPVLQRRTGWQGTRTEGGLGKHKAEERVPRQGVYRTALLWVKGLKGRRESRAKADLPVPKWVLNRHATCVLFLFLALCLCLSTSRAENKSIIREDATSQTTLKPPDYRLC